MSLPLSRHQMENMIKGIIIGRYSLPEEMMPLINLVWKNIVESRTERNLGV